MQNTALTARENYFTSGPYNMYTYIDQHFLAIFSV